MTLMVITITNGGWVDSLPNLQKPVTMHRIANLRDQTDDKAIVRVGGQHWDKENRV